MLGKVWWEPPLPRLEWSHHRPKFCIVFHSLHPNPCCRAGKEVWIKIPPFPAKTQPTHEGLLWLLAGLSQWQAVELLLSIQLCCFYPEGNVVNVHRKVWIPVFTQNFRTLSSLRGICLQTNREIHDLYLSRSSTCLAAQHGSCLLKVLNTL